MSGKTTAARIIIPYLLEPHIHKVVCTKAQQPCQKVFVDCSPLRSRSTYKSKLWGLYEAVAEELGVEMDPKVTEDKINHFALRELLRDLDDYHIITIDEYQMLLANLSIEESDRLAVELRNIMLDEGIAVCSNN